MFRLGPSIPKILMNTTSSFGLEPRILHKATLLRLFVESRELLMAKDVDVFSLHGLWDNQYEELALMLSKHFNKPLVVWLHGTYLSGPEAMPIPRRLGRELLERADAIIVHNNDVLDKLKEFKLEYKSHFIPTVVDIEHFNYNTTISGKSGLNAIFVGRLSQFKDPITPVRAFQYVNKVIPGSKLYIVGDGPLMGSLKILIKHLGLDESVILTGFQKDVKRFLCKGDVFLATSPVENYPSCSLLEALASGLPVVATDIGMTRELIAEGRNGLLVPPRDPERLGEAIVRIMIDATLRETLSSNARTTVMDLDVSKISPKIAEIYHSLSKK